jgi:deazaflavin-dependent oxidoreductase (nitroreductase family)
VSRPADYNAQNIAEFRKNHGKVGGYFLGAPLLLLDTIGRRSGKLHVCPVMYLKDGERLLVFASKGGSDSHPDWYFNLKANPDFQIEIGDERKDVHAEEITGSERDLMYNRQAALYPRFGDYQRKTRRTIPVIALTRRE